jgi:outer membrane protein OmpA-like peptidoglycan-associated protein
MKTKFGAVSLVALSLLVAWPVVSHAQTNNENSKNNVVPQSIPRAIQAMLDDPRKPPELSDDELRERIQLARTGLKLPGVPEKTLELLEKKRKFARAELDRRATAAVEEQPAPAPKRARQAEQTAEQTPGDDEPVPPKRVRQAEQAPETPVAVAPDSAEAMLNDGRPRERIPTPELSARTKRAFTMARDGNLPQGVRDKLVAMSRADRAELIRRQQQDEDGPSDEAAPQPRARAEQPAEPDVIVEAAPAPAPQPARLNPTEQEARQFLANSQRVDNLDDDRLRKRLNRMRGFLSSGQLQPATVEALRQRLVLERDTLRQRSGRGDVAATKPEQTRDKKKSNTNVEISIVLGDRRRSEDLTEMELQRRIEVYRDVERSQDYSSYDEDDRVFWRETMSRDRDLLRRRLLAERKERARQIAEAEDNGTLQRDIVIEARPRVTLNPSEDIYVAEADEDEIEDILVAAPREKIDRRYTVDEVSNDPRLRRAVPRLEIDTIRFGFGEAIVREEEVGKLDDVGSAMERILARYPNEVFLIEGHTDAVGSDVSNLGLSRARAEAVKRALATYYDIPAGNLRTVGLGERFLRIPTPFAEAENRRVSISRITNFVSQAE